MLRHLHIATGVAAAGLGLAACSGSSGPVALGPGDVVSQSAAQQAIPHAQVLESPFSFSLRGAAGSTLAGVCNRSFPSEALRKQREQTNYTIPGPQGHPVTAASNEVVSYRSEDAAGQAFDQLRQAIDACPSSYTLPGGPRLTQSHAVSLGAGLAPRTLSFAQYVDQSGQPVWEVNVYQFDGPYLSAVYAFDPSQSTAMSEARKLATDADAKIERLVSE